MARFFSSSSSPDSRSDMNPRLPRFTPSTGTPRMEAARAKCRMVPSPPKATTRSLPRSSCWRGLRGTPNCSSPPSGLKGRQYTAVRPTSFRIDSAAFAAAKPLSR